MPTLPMEAVSISADGVTVGRGSVSLTINTDRPERVARVTFRASGPTPTAPKEVRVMSDSGIEAVLIEPRLTRAGRYERTWHESEEGYAEDGWESPWQLVIPA